MTHNDSAPEIIRKIHDLRRRVKKWRDAGETIAFIPTMGALHAGHLSLVHHGANYATKTIASIFINPKQFAAHEDLDTYPKQEEADIKKLAAANCDVVYLPDPEEMYAPNAMTSVHIGELSDGLCGQSRPHFFGGVATIVSKLLNICTPDFAIFGEKDYQQLCIINRMVRDLCMPVEVLGAPIIRETDGLAMSSRNAYLNKQERIIAPALYSIMQETVSKIRISGLSENSLTQAKEKLLHAGISSIDYFEIRDEETLNLINAEEFNITTNSKRLFAAVTLGKTRLIDNLAI